MNRKFNFTNSTKPDVLRLEQHFTDMEGRRGSVIEWGELESVLQMDRHQNRFNTVLTVWRKQLKRKHGIWTVANIGEAIDVGLLVLSHDDQVYYSRKRYVQAGRRVKDGQSAVMNTDDSKLSEMALKRKEYELLAGRYLHSAMMESRRLRLPQTTNPPEVNPRP